MTDIAMEGTPAGAERAPRRNDVDAYVARRVRARRRELRLSQATLAEACGITFQQFQKCEKGVNRISAGRLWQIARALDVPVAYFFPPEDRTDG